MRSEIDTAFDFRSDTPPGKDPDALSPTLCRYHKELWSKQLPSGVVFELIDTTPHVYLHHRSEMGEFFLSSDAVIPSFTREHKIAHIIDAIPKEELDAFYTVAYTIGGMMVFPGNRIGGKMTINGARWQRLLPSQTSAGRLVMNPLPPAAAGGGAKAERHALSCASLSTEGAGYASTLE